MIKENKLNLHLQMLAKILRLQLLPNTLMKRMMIRVTGHNVLPWMIKEGNENYKKELIPTGKQRNLIF